MKEDHNGINHSNSKRIMDNNNDSPNQNSSSSNNHNESIEKKSFTALFAESLFGNNGYFESFTLSNRYQRYQQCMELQRALEDCERCHETPVIRSTKAPQRIFRRWGNNNNDDNKGNKNASVETLEPSSNIPKIEETRTGMKVARFYEWGLINPKAAAAIETMRQNENRSAMGTLNPVEALDKTIKDSSGTSSTTSESSSSSSSSTNKCTTNTSASASASAKHIQVQKNQSTIAKLSNTKDPCSREKHAVWACRAIALGCSSDLVNLRSCFQKKIGSTNPPKCYYNDEAPVDADDIAKMNDSDCRIAQRILARCVKDKSQELESKLQSSSNSHTR